MDSCFLSSVGLVLSHPPYPAPTIGMHGQDQARTFLALGRAMILERAKLTPKVDNLLLSLRLPREGLRRSRHS